jgi:hypothetical protein
MAEQRRRHVAAGNSGGEDTREFATDLKPVVRHREEEGESSRDPGRIVFDPDTCNVDIPEPSRHVGSGHKGTHHQGVVVHQHSRH